MQRSRSKIVIGVLVGLAVLLGLNALVTGEETKSAEVTVPGGRILELSGGDLQVVERGSRGAPPIVLLHGWTCAIDWWDRMMPLLSRKHRVVAIDLLGHGGSEKPSSGYSMENQADLVAQTLDRLGVRDATVVGHSMGAVVGTALSETAPEIVDRLVVVDQAPDNDGYGSGVPLTVALTFTPVIGEALWRATPDFAIEDGLSVGFAPGYDVPFQFVDDFRRLTYTSYDASAEAETSYTDALSLDERLRRTRVPVLAIFGAEEQIYTEPEKALEAYRAIGAQTELVPGAGHSPTVERPAYTAALVLRFAHSPRGKRRLARTELTANGPAVDKKKGRPEGRPK